MIEFHLYVRWHDTEDGPEQTKLVGTYSSRLEALQAITNYIGHLSGMENAPRHITGFFIGKEAVKSLSPEQA
jgi:hypothetical protein